MIKELTHKPFKLEEICAIANQFTALLSLTFEMKYKWPIQQIANPFIEKAKEIIDKKNATISKYLKPGEVLVTGEDNIRNCRKEVTEFESVMQEMPVRTVDIGLIPETLIVGDISLIQYFFTSENK